MEEGNLEFVKPRSNEGFLLGEARRALTVRFGNPVWLPLGSSYTLGAIGSGGSKKSPRETKGSRIFVLLLRDVDLLYNLRLSMFSAEWTATLFDPCGGRLHFPAAFRFHVSCPSDDWAPAVKRPHETRPLSKRNPLRATALRGGVASFEECWQPTGGPHSAGSGGRRPPQVTSCSTAHPRSLHHNL